MLHTNEKVIKNKIGLINLAQELGNISKGYKTMGYSREHPPGYLGSQDAFYVGNLKGVDRIYQQTFVDIYSKVACYKLYATKTPITSADLLNDQVLPYKFDQYVCGSSSD